MVKIWCENGQCSEDPDIRLGRKTQTARDSDSDGPESRRRVKDSDGLPNLTSESSVTSMTNLPF